MEILSISLEFSLVEAYNDSNIQIVFNNRRDIKVG